jgi:hypothetical protein
MDENSKKLLIAIGIIIALFAVGFLLRFFLDSDEVLTIDELHRRNIEGEESEINYMYNGFSFVYLDNLWYTQIKRKDDAIIDVPLHFSPKDLEEVPITGTLDKRFYQEEIYITFDPDETGLTYVALSTAELSLNLAKGIEVMPIASCSKNETDACKDRPIVNCDDKEKAIVYFKKGDGEGRIRLRGNCVELIGDEWEIVKATNRFLFYLYHVME